MTISADFLVNGSYLGPDSNRVFLVTPGATVTVALVDTSGAVNPEWTFIGESEATAYPTVSVTGRGVATFTAPASPGHGFGLTIVLQCTNAGQRSTALICVGTITQIASNETTERGEGTGWVEQMNVNQRVAGGGEILRTYASNAAFRAETDTITDNTLIRILSPSKEFRYSSSSGAGWADDDNTILKQTSVLVGSNGRAFSTAQGAVCPTVDAVRGLVGGKQDHVHVQSHTAFGDGGGGIFDRVAVGSYVDDNGTVIVAGSYAYVRRDRNTGTPTPKWWGGAGDYNRTADTGGALDNAAIHACQAYAVARRKSWAIPDGNYLLTTQLALSNNESIICESFDKCVIHCKCDSPLAGLDTRQGITVNGGAWLATDPTCDVCFDFLSGYTINVDIAVGGTWSRGFQCYKDGGDRASHGFLYVAHPLRIRSFDWSSAHGFAFPGRVDRIIHLDGDLIDIELHPQYNQPEDNDAGVYVNNYSGGISHSITVAGIVAGNGGTSLPVVGVHIIGVNGVNVKGLYAESCQKAVLLEDCQFVKIGPNLDGSRVHLKNCTTGHVSPQQTYVIYEQTTGLTEHGAGFGTPGLTGAWESNNVDVVGGGFSKQAGLIYSKSGRTHTDGQNLLLNGDFRRWTGGVPWGWTWSTPAGSSITQCGDGLGDTTRPANTPYCGHFVTDGSSIITGLHKLTGPLGDQYLGSTVAVQVKVKRTSGHQVLSITNSSGTGSGNMWLEQQTTASEDGWETFTTQCIITANEQSGLYLSLVCAVNTDAYIGAIDVQFGRQCPRSFNLPRVSADGTVERLPGGPIRVYSSSIPGATDPFLGKAYLAGDQAMNTTGASPIGWVYSGTIWVPITANEEDELVTSIRKVDTSNKISCLLLGADFTGSGSWVARIGSNAASAGASQATVGTIRNRAAAVFATGGSSQGYTLPTNQAEYWAVGRYDGSLPVSGFPSLVGGAGAGPRLMGNNGTSNLINDSTITRDGASSVALDDVTRIWRSTDTGSADARHVGSYGPNVANNWIGPIGLAMAVTSAFTTEEADAIYQLIKAYFAK